MLCLLRHFPGCCRQLSQANQAVWLQARACVWVSALASIQMPTAHVQQDSMYVCRKYVCEWGCECEWETVWEYSCVHLHVGSVEDVLFAPSKTPRHIHRDYVFTKSLPLSLCALYVHWHINYVPSFITVFFFPSLFSSQAWLQAQRTLLIINTEVKHGKNFWNKINKAQDAVSLRQSTIKGALPVLHWLLPKPHGLWSEWEANDKKGKGRPCCCSVATKVTAETSASGPIHPPPTPPTPPPPRQSVIGALMSDDVNYVSNYFYTKKQGQIGSLPELWLQTGWQVDGVIWK